METCENCGRTLIKVGCLICNNNIPNIEYDLDVSHIHVPKEHGFNVDDYMKIPQGDYNRLLGEMLDFVEKCWREDNLEIKNRTLREKFNELSELSNLETVVSDEKEEDEADKVLREVLVRYIEAGKISSKHREEAVLEAMHVFAEKFICNQEEQMKFAEWVYDQMYRKYFGSEGENVNEAIRSVCFSQTGVIAHVTGLVFLKVFLRGVRLDLFILTTRKYECIKFI